MSAERALGVDFGGVINADPMFFSAAHLDSRAVADSFNCLAALNKTSPYAGRIHVVSKCFPNIEAKTRAWLGHNGFHAETGIPEEHLHFSRSRPGKADIARELGLDTFVDDRRDVLEHVGQFATRLFLLDVDAATALRITEVPGVITAVPGWEVLHAYLQHDIEA